MFTQYQIIELTRDLNPVVKAGMKGTILEIWSNDSFEVEFLDKEGCNYEHEGKGTFTVNAIDIKHSSAD